MSAEKISSGAERFAALFKGNPRSTGKYDPKTGKMHTDHEQVTLSNYERHVEGKYGIGLVPILDDDTCWWGAVDIDNHGKDEDIPIGPIDKKLAGLSIPVVPCRSKSGGVHVYAFFDKPWAAAKVRVFLQRIAKDVGYPDSEIFPKQAHLSNQKQGGKQLGNWINLPYLGGDDTVRYAYRNGRKLTLGEFLDFVEQNKVTTLALADQIKDEHKGAPPCIQRMMIEGVAKGRRNEALYQISVYTRKAFGDSYVDKAKALNLTVFDSPLARAEAERTINSAGRPDNRYRCGEDPQKSFCDRDTCIKREYGITPADDEVSRTLEDIPTFTDVVKYLSDPVRWEIKVDGQIVTNVSTEDLLDWRWIRKTIAERLTKVVPLIKNQEWERILQPLMAEARVVVAPEDASVAGLIRQRLREFAAKAHDLRKNQTVEDRQALLRGLPILAKIDGVTQIVFRSQDFVNYLKRTKSEELKGVNLWFSIRDFGVQTTRMRVTKEKSIHVWYVPHKEVEIQSADAAHFESEL